MPSISNPQTRFATVAGDFIMIVFKLIELESRSKIKSKNTYIPHDDFSFDFYF